jgi:endonuclease/exonuclease/phosphatase family metal-dependent hydrolase
MPMRIFRKILTWLSCLLITALLMSAWLPVLNPGKWWIAGFAGFFFPILFPLCLLLLPFLLRYRHKKLLWYCTAAVIVCLPAALSTWGVHIFRKNNIRTANDRQFTVMTYNTSSMGLVKYRTDKEKEATIYAEINASSPDILCLEEFYSNDAPDKEQHIQRIMQAGHYTAHYFTRDKIHWDTWNYGIALFSRFPVIGAQAIPCGQSLAGSGSSFLQADLLIKGDTIRVFAVQLTSYMFNDQDYNNLQTPFSGGLINKMRSTFEQRSSQAQQLAALIAQSPFPVVVCGDLNDTPTSFTYRTVSKNMQDVFLETGSGLGRTLSFLSPTLRIDYILCQAVFDIHGGKVPRPASSEHFPVVACLSLKSSSGNTRKPGN